MSEKELVKEMNKMKEKYIAITIEAIASEHKGSKEELEKMKSLIRVGTNYDIVMEWLETF